MNTLIGYTGFVGSTLLKQLNFHHLYCSTNIHEITGRKFGLVICAGAPAQKWLANKEPQSDAHKIQGLINHLKSIECNCFVLISTVDVFKNSSGATELTPVQENDLHPYGLHRRMLEKFVQQHFENHLIVRLPGLVGPGLRKNVIFDFHNNNNLHAIDSRGVFQFYPMMNLSYDINTALAAQLKIVHLTAEPISVEELFLEGFGKKFIQPLSGHAAAYDMQSVHTSTYGRQSSYTYSKRDTIQAVRTYAQSEPVSRTNSTKSFIS